MSIFNRDNNKLAQVTSQISTNDSFNLLSDGYKKDADGGVDGGIKAPGVLSLFNAFNVFRYSKFGLNVGEYNKDYHFDSNIAEAPGNMLKYFTPAKSGESDFVNDTKGNFKSFSSERQYVENPTAQRIIEWSRRNVGSEKSNPMTPMPYATSDFLWCKYYGKVPNNRMLTLRRYPIPVEDNIDSLPKERGPFVPLAQAVSWYGSDIDNDLNNIINVDWGYLWKDLDTEVQDVAGNEISVDALLEVLGVENKDSPLYKQVKAQLFAGNDSISFAKLTGFDSKMQEYVKGAYGPKGPYWNRILGPVNVVNKTRIRDRGFNYMRDITLNFDYSLRSYGNINPKIAFLDLLTNFLSLTYNTAPFWGGSIRYFAQTGITLDPLGMEEAILKGDVPEAMAKGMEALSAQVKAGLGGLQSTINEMAKAIKDPEGEKRRQAADKAKGLSDARNYSVTEDLAGIANKMIAGKLGALMQSPLSYRAILDGRAIGEWHLTVGNPMNPIAMIGNLVVSDVKMTVGETLGLDDFPTEFSFKVTLKHGRPRAKQDIESMFNLGNGFMSTSKVAPPSAANQSYGEQTDLKTKQFGVNRKVAAKANDKADVNETAGVSNANTGGGNEQAMKDAKARVSAFYGSGFGNDNIPAYFKTFVTKD